MSFAYPYALIALGGLIPLTYLYIWRLPRWRFALPMPAEADSRSFALGAFFFSHIGWFFYALALGLLIIALARPQIDRQTMPEFHEGLDIYLVLDTSMSMAEQDLTIAQRPVTRLDAVKAVVSEFITARPHDRIGLVIFGSSAFAQAPLTTDHRVLKQFLGEVKIGMAGENTAIGDAIGVASNRFLSVDAPTKIMILLTDGANSAGTIAPEQAAQAARGLGIKIYTIAVVGQRMEMFGMKLPVPSFDTEILKYIASTTGGQFFSARSTDALQKIYQTIDKLETTEVEENDRLLYTDLFPYFLLGSMASLGGFLLLGLIAWRRWP